MGWGNPIPKGLTIKSAALSVNVETQVSSAIVTAFNGSGFLLNYILIDCTAISSAGNPIDVATAAVKNVTENEVVYGQAVFLKDIEGGSHISCRINDAG